MGNSELEGNVMRRSSIIVLFLGAMVLSIALVSCGGGDATKPAGDGTSDGTDTLVPQRSPTIPAALAGLEGAVYGDNWKASLQIEICGEVLPPLGPSRGNINSKGDGFIYLAPQFKNESGLFANLERFFNNTGTILETDRIKVGQGNRYFNGDLCPDGTPGQVEILVNGIEITEVYKIYTPQDGDEVEIYFR